MCFETDTAGGAPIPQRKPSPHVRNTGVNGNENSVLGSLWDTALGGFKSIGSIELERYQTKRLASLREKEVQAKQDRSNVLAGTAQRFIGYTSAPQTQNGAFLLSTAMVAGAFLLLLRGR